MSSRLFRILCGATAVAVVIGGAAAGERVAYTSHSRAGATATAPRATASGRGSAGRVTSNGRTRVTAARVIGHPQKVHHHLSQRLWTIAAAGHGHAPAAQAVSAEDVAAGLPTSGAGSLLHEPDGRLIVTMRLAAVTSAAVTAIRAIGGQVLNVDRQLGHVTAAVPAAQLTRLGNLPGVQYVAENLTPEVAGVAGTEHAGASAAMAAGGSAAATSTSASCDPIVSEGDTILHAADERSTYGVDGTGETVGLLSDSYDTDTNAPTTAAQDVANGELPGAGNPCGYTTPVDVLQDSADGEDEGRAMAQTVHSLAPGAAIDFATAFDGEDGFAANIRALAAAGANVIADDVTYYDEPFFQQGEISQAVNDVRAQGVDFFSSAANNSTVLDGHEVGSWQANAYRPTTCPNTTFSADLDCMNFNDSGSGAADPTFGFTAAGTPGYYAPRLAIDMQWAEPLGGVQNNFEIFLLNSAGTVVASSKTNAVAAEDPFQFLSYSKMIPGQSYSIVIARAQSTAGAALPAIKMVFQENGAQPFASMQYETPSGPDDTMGPTAYGHNDGPETEAVAASSVTTSPGAVDAYSTEGPVTYYFGPVNSVAPAAALHTPEVLRKPDLTASDCVQNSFFGSYYDNAYRFCGTSDAAPHAAAAAALLLAQAAAAGESANPEQINTALADTATSLGGAADQQGAGLINVLAAGNALSTASAVRLTSSASDPVTYGQPITVTAVVASPSAPATGSVTLADGGTTYGPVTLDRNGRATFSLNDPAAVGTHQVVASYSGATSVAPASLDIEVVPAPQSISLTSTPSATASVGQTYVPVVTGGDSGNPVVTTTTTSACTVAPDGTTIDLVHVGTCGLAFNQAGDESYLAARQVTQTFTVEQGTQTVDFDSTPPAPATVGSTYVTATSASSGLTPVVESVDPATTGFGQAGQACALQSDLVTVDLLAAGTCVIDADQAGNADYAAAPQAQQSFAVQQVGSTVTVQQLPSIVYGQTPTAVADVTAAAGAIDGTVQFSVDGSPIGQPVDVDNGQAVSASLADSDGNPLAVGGHDIAATFTPTNGVEYATATSNPVTITVAKDATSTAVQVAAGSLTATVGRLAPASGFPSGTVTFGVAGHTVGTASLDDGEAVLPYSVPLGRTRQISAVYAGDSEDTGSSASTSRTDPTITARLSSATARTRYGWYRSPVTVTFTCTAGTARLTTGCPAAVRLARNGAGQSVTRTVLARDGGAATVTAGGIDIDHTAPTVALAGPRDHGTYEGSAPVARCAGHDALSGIATCTLTRTSTATTTGLNTTVVRWTTVATDRAGNTATRHGVYRVLGIYLRGAPFSGGAFDTGLGRTYALVVTGTTTRPSYVDAAPLPARPHGPGVAFYRAGDDQWQLQVTLSRALGSHQRWDLGVRVGAELHQVPIRFGT